MPSAETLTSVCNLESMGGMLRIIVLFLLFGLLTGAGLTRDFGWGYWTCVTCLPNLTPYELHYASENARRTADGHLIVQRDGRSGSSCWMRKVRGYRGLREITEMGSAFTQETC